MTKETLNKAMALAKEVEDAKRLLADLRRADKATLDLHLHEGTLGDMHEVYKLSTTVHAHMILALEQLIVDLERMFKEM